MSSTELVFWQQAREAVVHKITVKEAFEQELGIKFAEPWGCEGAGGTFVGGA